MSRTYRRKKKSSSRWFTFTYMGNFDEFEKNYYCWKGEKGLTVRQAFEKRLVCFHGDNHPGLCSVPSWYTNMYWTRPSRRYEQREIHRCIRLNDWDDHQPLRRGIFRPYWW